MELPSLETAAKMQPLELTEYQECVWDAPLDHVQLQAVAAAHISVSPSVDREGAHLLRPSSWVGAVNIGDRSVIVRPKIPVDRVMFLMTYALDPRHWRNEAIDLTPDSDVLEAVALAFLAPNQRAIHRGLLRGYRREEDALSTVRGQIRFADQIGRRYGLTLPIEVAYDEYTEDIEHNRLLKTALHRLSHAQIRSMTVRQELRRPRSAFDMVQLGAYRRGVVPAIRYTRLDEHYRPAVELARLIIENSSLKLFGGKVSGASFLIDMNVVFEQFLYVALGEALNLTRDRWQHQARLKLDKGGSINMEPDLSWWASRPGGGTLPRFVGDAKYKSWTRRASGMLTSTRCWPTAPPPICHLVCSSTPTERESRPSTGSIMPRRPLRWLRWTSREHRKPSWAMWNGWPSGFEFMLAYPHSIRLHDQDISTRGHRQQQASGWGKE